MDCPSLQNRGTSLALYGLNRNHTTRCDALLTLAGDEWQCCEHALVQQGYPKVEVLQGKQRYEHAWESADQEKEHTEGKAPPQRARKILSDLRRTAEGDNAASVDESGDEP